MKKKNIKIEERIKDYLKLIILFFLYYFSSLFISFKNVHYFLLSRILMSTLVIFFALFLYRKELTKDWKIFKKNPKEQMSITFKYWALGLLIMISSNFLLQKANLGMSQNETSIRAILQLSPLLGTLAVGIFGPLVEEIIFRKAFYEAIKKPVLFIVISSVIFGFLHIASSYTAWYDLFFLIPYSSLGVVFGISLIKTKSVIPVIIVHVIHNLSIAFLTFLFAGVIL